MKILVTGGAGYKGSILIPKLIEDGHHIICVDTFWFGDYLEKNPSLVKLKADISLFRYKKEYDTSFLAKEPISVGYYNEIKEEMIWDFEYNRSMVEKIIHAMTKK